MANLGGKDASETLNYLVTLPEEEGGPIEDGDGNDIANAVQDSLGIRPSSVQTESYGCITSNFEDTVEVEEGVNHLHLVWECSAPGSRRLTININSADLPTNLYTRFLITLYAQRDNTDGVDRDMRFRLVLDGQRIIEHDPFLPGNTSIEYQVGFEMILTGKGWAPLFNNEAFISGSMT